MKKILLGLLLGTGLLTLTGCFGEEGSVDTPDSVPGEAEVPNGEIELTSEEIVVEGDFAYKVREEGLELIYSAKQEGDIVIPDEVDDIPVIGIGYKTFFNSNLLINGIGGTGITSLTLGENIETIGERAFSSNRLTSVIIPDSVITIGDFAFSSNELTSVIIGDSVKTIGEYAFAGNELTGELIIPDSVTTIGDFAFLSNGLASVIIGTGIETIGDSAFHQNNDLTKVTFMGGVIIDENSFSDSVVFYDKDNKVIWNSTEATNNVLEPKALIESLKSDFSTEEYQRDLLNNSNSGSLSKDDFVVEGDFTYMKTADGLELIHSDVREGEIVIPDEANDIEITSIAYFAFVGVVNIDGNGSGITKLTLGDNIKVIGVGAFWANGLTSVTIGSSVTTIGEGAFSSNELTSVTIGDSVTTIGDSAFHTNNLTSVTIPDSVTTIGDSAFRSNELTSVTLGNSVTTIGDSAFFNNELTGKLIIPDSVKTIGDYAFEDNELTSLTIGDNVTTIGDYAFEGNEITSVTMGDSVTTIGNSAFSNNGLTSVTIGDNVTTIGGFAFAGNNLTSVTIGTGIQTIGSSAFYQNRGLNEVTFRGGVIINESEFNSNSVFYDASGSVIYKI